jgi:hypothetical protein
MWRHDERSGPVLGANFAQFDLTGSGPGDVTDSLRKPKEEFTTRGNLDGRVVGVSKTRLQKRKFHRRNHQGSINLRCSRQ